MKKRGCTGAYTFFKNIYLEQVTSHACQVAAESIACSLSALEELLLQADGPTGVRHHVRARWFRTADALLW